MVSMKTNKVLCERQWLVIKNATVHLQKGKANGMGMSPFVES
jgi:hypothetical protein